MGGHSLFDQSLCPLAMSAIGAAKFKQGRTWQGVDLAAREFAVRVVRFQGSQVPASGAKNFKAVSITKPGCSSGMKCPHCATEPPSTCSATVCQ